VIGARGKFRGVNFKDILHSECSILISDIFAYDTEAQPLVENSSRGGVLDPDVFNLELRKFLKKFGVTSQREIEAAVEAALARGSLRGTEVLAVRATLEIPGVLSGFRVDGEIALASPPMPPAA
jgi:hypothetical protein